MRDRICIILVNWNGKKDTLECLDSLTKVDYPLFSVIVVDNGSQDGSVAAIRAAHPHVPIFETGENLGFAGGNNVGISWALSKPFKWILLLNNDTTVDPDFLNAFMRAAEQQPEAKILGAKILRAHEPTRIDHLGGRWNPAIAEFESLSAGDPAHLHTDMQPVDYVCGAALLMHRSVPEAIGLLEPRFFLFWEETDFCFRARRKGFSIWTAPEAKVWHKVSASFIGGKPHSHYYWWRSRLLWLERNLPPSERQALHRTLIRPELLKTLRHYFFRSSQHFLSRLILLPSNSQRLAKLKRLKAGLAGAIDYYRGRFGNCPPWLLK
ncbi:MAG: glycosyltransferase family 2 protein [Verrucomicrobiota bacterium]|nr:glycosyltransferase family 2 protein [Verrucomicrobiota bacterium]